jgi:hypothetical protein
MPSVTAQARNAAGAVARQAGAFFSGATTRVSDEVFTARMNVCKSCPHVAVTVKEGKNYHRCSKCGCWLDGLYMHKARLSTERCPENKWIE